MNGSEEEESSSDEVNVEINDLVPPSINTSTDKQDSGIDGIFTTKTAFFRFRSRFLGGLACFIQRVLQIRLLQIAENCLICRKIEEKWVKNGLISQN